MLNICGRRGVYTLHLRPYMLVERPSIYLSHRSPPATVTGTSCSRGAGRSAANPPGPAGLLLSALQEISSYQSTAAAGASGQKQTLAALRREPTEESQHKLVQQRKCRNMDVFDTRARAPSPKTLAIDFLRSLPSLTRGI